MISEKQAERYCYQDISLIENYDKAVADKEHKWACHHRVETIMNCSRKELKVVGAYYDRPANELIFLRQDEHQRLHQTGKKHFLGHHHSEETKRKMSDSNKGKRRSEDTRRKISEARKRYWENRRAGK